MADKICKMSNMDENWYKLVFGIANYERKVTKKNADPIWWTINFRGLI